MQITTVKGGASVDQQQEIEKMAEIMQQGEIDRETGKIDCSEFALCAVVKNGMQRLAGATALINAGYGNVRAAVEDVAERIKNALFCELADDMSFKMASKIEKAIKEACDAGETAGD